MAPLIHIVRHADPMNYDEVADTQDLDMEDPDLNHIGRNRCIALSANTDGVRSRMHMLLCSPSLRAMRIAELAFYGKTKNSLVKITPIPLLQEIGNYRMNVPADKATINARHMAKIDDTHLVGDYQSRGPGQLYGGSHQDNIKQARLARQLIRRLVREAVDRIGTEDVEVLIVTHLGIGMYLAEDYTRQLPLYASVRSFRFKQWDQLDSHDPEALLDEVPQSEVDALDSQRSLTSFQAADRHDPSSEFKKTVTGKDGPFKFGRPSSDGLLTSAQSTQESRLTSLQQNHFLHCDNDTWSMIPPPPPPTGSETNVRMAKIVMYRGDPQPVPLSAAQQEAQRTMPVYDYREFKVVQSRFTEKLRQRARQIQRFVVANDTNDDFNDLVYAQAQALQPPLKVNPLTFGPVFDTEERWPIFFDNSSSVQGFLNLQWNAMGRWSDWDYFLRPSPNIFGQSLPK